MYDCVCTPLPSLGPNQDCFTVSHTTYTANSQHILLQHILEGTYILKQ